MTITVSSLGQNSGAISYSPSTTVDELSNALRTALSSMGWQVFDMLSATDTVYRATTVDNVVHKYMRLNFSGNYIYMSCYENWNDATGEGVNLAYGGAQATWSQRYDLANGGVLFVFATARYAVLLSRTAGDVWGTDTDNTFSAVFEVSRDNPEEIAGDYPPSFLTTGSWMVGYLADSSYPNCGAMPRTELGHTDIEAFRRMSIQTVCGGTRTSAAQARLRDQLPGGVHPLSTTGSTQVYTPYLVNRMNNFVRGRLHGIKILPRNIGSVMDKINIRVNNELFYDANGAMTYYHHILTSSTSGCRFAIPE